MKRFLRNCYIEFRIQLRILRLYCMRMKVPDDAKTPEQMLAEIKKRSQAYLDCCCDNGKNE